MGGPFGSRKRAACDDFRYNDPTRRSLISAVKTFSVSDFTECHPSPDSECCSTTGTAEQTKTTASKPATTFADSCGMRTGTEPLGSLHSRRGTRSERDGRSV